MKLTLQDKNRGIKIAWVFMIITIGAFLNEIKDAIDTIKPEGGSLENGFEAGYPAGSKLGLIFLLGMGMLLYTRTKKRKLGYSVWGSKIIDYILVFILAINFVFPLFSGRWVNGSGDDVLAFFYVTVSLLTYIYVLLAKPKVEPEKKDNPKVSSQLQS